MPGTLPVHQTSEELLASTSNAMATDITGSSISSSGGKTSHLSGASQIPSTNHDDMASSHSSSHGGASSSSGGSSGVSHSTGQSNPTSTVRMGKMLDTQPRSRTNTRHQASTSGR